MTHVVAGTAHDVAEGVHVLVGKRAVQQVAYDLDVTGEDLGDTGSARRLQKRCRQEGRIYDQPEPGRPLSAA